MSGIDARKAVFRNCDGPAAVFAAARLANADFSKANLSGSDFSKVKADGILLTDSTLIEANFSGASLITADLSRANARGAKFVDAKMNDLRGEGVNLSGATCSRVAMENAKLAGADLTGADFTDANLGQADLQGVRASRARFRRAILRAVRLARADLSHADLKDCAFEKADLTLADLSQTILWGAIFTGANVQGTFFELASFNGFTVLPFSVQQAIALGMDRGSSDLVLHLDAAQADSRAAYSVGCTENSLRWSDLSFTGLDGVLNGFASCKDGSGWAGTGNPGDPYRLKFNGKTEYISVAASRELDTKTELTMVAWLRPQGNHVGSLMEYGTPIGYGPHMWQYDTGTKFFINLIDTMGRSMVVDGVPVPVVSGNWYLTAVTYNGARAAAYLNGQEVAANETAGRTTLATNTAFYLGHRLIDPNSYFEGDIAEAWVYNRGLTALEINNICRKSQARFGVKCESR